MSAHDIIKQSARIAGVIKDDKKRLKHKIGEVLLEIIIIIFAISISLLFERWRQEAEDHKLEISFLKGLKIDLTRDLEQLKQGTARWMEMKEAAHYFVKPPSQINWNKDSISFYGFRLFHNVYFFPSTNRY